MDKLIKSSAQKVSQTAQHVQINHSKINQIAQEILSQMRISKYSFQNWKHKLHPCSINSNTPNAIFFIDLMNFSFWSERDKIDRYPFTVNYDGINYTGYWSLCAIIKNCELNNIDITNPFFYSNCSKETLRNLFNPVNDSCQNISLLDKRIDMLRIAGKILVQKYNGNFKNIILKANKSAQNLISIVLIEFGDLFDDHLLYNGNLVYFQKRVQILVADIWACYQNNG